MKCSRKPRKKKYDDYYDDKDADEALPFGVIISSK